MSREIEFRGMDLNGEWVFGFLISENQIRTKRCGIVYYLKSNTVGQYTGINDKNGKKIFEGDIIICPGFDQDIIMHFIKYNVIKARFEVEHMGIGEASGGIDQEWINEFEFEVTGNIYVKDLSAGSQ